ncbi:NTP transferase domain-containing protein [Halarcobacter bivalviorum]|uniref:Choline-phosphate cytidylyltransferase n=1 Tax=Halarcobacter bivalviorum TaxID=663364 RepID=A0AAX2AAA5_9BACT|nr:phosphocholine cytidylyltransferase family protein [Halarcobacter bivalviorum]AXH13386.1 phosphocholine cytidylyltransferase [Halarcobacter bivalviorum]RXK10013.1 choline-phosphate cytidylyltransferase [Halarcobacter bivalviorum]
MKVLIMAAGVGSRISRHLQGQPKCCVDINGQPLIRYTMELLKKKGIKEIAIVTGYQERYIHQALEGLSYVRYFNPFFRVANSISSVWFARDFLTPDDDIMIMNGDVFMEEKVLDILLAEKRSPLMLSDSTRIEDADYRFNWEGEFLKKYGKHLTNNETTGEYVGIGILNKSDLQVFKQNVIDAVSNEDYSCWWEDIIYRTVEDGKKVYVNDIAGVFWAEVDYIEDYERIKDFIS